MSGGKKTRSPGGFNAGLAAPTAACSARCLADVSPICRRCLVPMNRTTQRQRRRVLPCLLRAEGVGLARTARGSRLPEGLVWCRVASVVLRGRRFRMCETARLPLDKAAQALAKIRARALTAHFCRDGGVPCVHTMLPHSPGPVSGAMLNANCAWNFAAGRSFRSRHCDPA